MSRILIVDDESDIAESLEVMLRAQGYDVETASNGADGLRKISTAKPDVVLLDVMMPGLSGFEVCRRLKNSKETETIPVLLLTALNQPEDKVKGLDAGADDFVEKPFDEAELTARIRAFLRTKILRDELEKSYQKLRELEQLRDSLIHMLVHDLKAPLTAIKGGVAVLGEYAGSSSDVPPPVRRLLANAESGSQRLLDMIQDILDVSRLEEKKLPVQKSRVLLFDLIESSLQMLRPIAEERGVRMEVVNAVHIPPLMIDPSLTQRVLVNLLSNSLKFTESGGSVKITTSYLQHKHIECVVSDTGVGIPKSVLPHLFEKFFQGNNAELSRKGQGLGLAFCRLAVESQGGTIHAESESGQGSRFIVRFPVS